MAYTELVIEMKDDVTSIFQKGVGLLLCQPSLIAFNKIRNRLRLVAVGNEAKKLVGKTDELCHVESPIKNCVIKDEHLATMMLKNMLEIAFENKSIPTTVPSLPLVSSLI